MPKGIYKRAKSSPLKGRKYSWMIGENNPRWNDGNSEYPNHIELKRARIEVLKRCKCKCEICGETAKIVHHINGDKSDHSLNNLIALCNNCHINLHRDENGKYIGGRPTKYGSMYGMPLREIARIFGVCPSTIHCWIKNPEKKKWAEEKLKEYFEKGDK